MLGIQNSNSLLCQFPNGFPNGLLPLPFPTAFSKFWSQAWPQVLPKPRSPQFSEPFAIGFCFPHPLARFLRSAI